MPQTGERQILSYEERELRGAGAGANGLQGNRSAEPLVPRAVNRSHATHAELLVDAVPPRDHRALSSRLCALVDDLHAERSSYEVYGLGQGHARAAPRRRTQG